MRKPRNKFNRAEAEKLRKEGYNLHEIAQKLDLATGTCAKNLRNIEVVRYYKEAEDKFVVYECYDISNTCIYVGQSYSLYARLSQHRLKSSFYSEITKIVCYVLDSFPDMAFLEAQMIIQKQPKYNIRIINSKESIFTVHFIERIEFNMNGVRIN